MTPWERERFEESKYQWESELDELNRRVRPIINWTSQKFKTYLSFGAGPLLRQYTRWTITEEAKHIIAVVYFFKTGRWPEEDLL